ncbi:MAG: DUF4136 domain-containing protein [bacterium]
MTVWAHEGVVAIRSALLFCACLLLAGFGCSAIKVQADYDKDADFRSLKTYDWLENRPGFSGTAASETEREAEIGEIIETAAGEALTGKGYRRDAVNPDVLLSYHVGSDTQIDVSAWGYRYARSYWGWHGRGADVSVYRPGTLIVDLIDSDTMTLIWRGAVPSVIEDPMTLQAARERIPVAVHEMFKGYPPAQ